MKPRDDSAPLYKWQYAIALLGVLVAAFAAYVQWWSKSADNVSPKDALHITNNCGSAIVSGNGNDVKASSSNCQK